MAPPAKLRHQAGNLPADLTTFVGRRAERTTIRRLVAESRLVTLTGFGGVGKTRLAMRAASEMQRAFLGGVWLVELANLDNPSLLSDTVAKTVGLRVQGPGTTLDALIERFSRQRAMLVVDNCEHLVDSCAELLGELLRGCPDLHVLATSREALGILGEVTFPVTPLPVPPEETLNTAGVTDWDAITLFLERARAAEPGFELTAENRDAVFGICRGLEGIPLALELAAVRLRALAPAQLLDRLSDHLHLLTSGNRNASDRQRTLRGCIDWSYHLCTATEQDLWARISVFAGGFELEAAEAVCHDPAGGLNRASVVDGVLSLVDRSVLIRETRGGTTRYRMLESLRQYGFEQLQSAGPSQVVLGKHRDFYFDMAVRSEAESVRGTQRAWMDRLRREHPNLQSALESSLNGDDCADRGLQAAGHIREHWIGMGAPAEGRHWLERLLAADGVRPASRALGLRTATWLATVQGDLAAAECFLQQLRTLVGTEGAGDEESVALFHEAFGHYAIYTDDPRVAIRECELALPVFEAHGKLARAVGTQILLQMAHSRAGDFDAALRWHTTCLETTARTGDTWFRSYSLWQAGLTRLQQGDNTKAVEALRSGLQLKADITDAMGVAMCLEALAWATVGDDRYRAAVLFGAAAARWSAMGLHASVLPQTTGAHVACEVALRQAMSHDEFSAATRWGMDLSMEDVLKFVVDEDLVKPPATTVDPVKSPLTRREHEVALLVARGLSNRDIAGTLVISPRTAESHVEHILVKLGFTSRAQIAAWVAERQPGHWQDRSPAEQAR